ncbi:puattive membrane protein [Clostridium botulinum A1 str. CFSAN002368]|nr:puattive membrane protein [Clostridium botulinum A1 str. CFSAN002368]
MEELEAYTKKAANIQTNLENYFIEKKFVRIAYVMYVDNEMKSVVVTYKKEDGKYILENTSIVDEKYKKAADALK